MLHCYPVSLMLAGNQTLDHPNRKKGRDFTLEYHQPPTSSLLALGSLPPIGLCVLERKTRGALIGTRLPAYPAIAASKQDAP
jgi:hypothetical protein